ncbi:MAG: hypothetical protein QW469_00545 [Candidatus Aenigmatarchaeota archaeon]
MKTSRELIAEIDTYYDKPFVKVLIKKIQDLDPDIGAVIALDKKLLVFIKNEMVIYKVILDKENMENIPMETHIERVKSVLNLLKSGFVIPSQFKKNFKKINQKYVKRY